MQRGERIIGDLRLGGGDGGEEGRFAGVRQTDEAGVGNELEPQKKRALDAGLAGIGPARGAVGRQTHRERRAAMAVGHSILVICLALAAPTIPATTTTSEATTSPAGATALPPPRPPSRQLQALGYQVTLRKVA